MSPRLVILAAGLGRRFGGEKQMAAVTPAGATLLDFIVFDGLRAGFGDPIVVVRPDLVESLGDHLREQFGPTLRPVLVAQSPPLGTGHALLCAVPHLDGPFAVANADDFYGRSAYQALGERLRVPGVDSYVTAYRLADTLSPFGGVSRAVCRSGHGDFLDGLTEVLDIREEAGEIRGRSRAGEIRLTGDELISMNLWGLRPNFLAALRAVFAEYRHATGEEFRLSDAMGELLRRKEIRVRLIPVREKGFGITYAEDVGPTRARIGQLVARGEYPERLSCS